MAWPLHWGSSMNISKLGDPLADRALCALEAADCVPRDGDFVAAVWAHGARGDVACRAFVEALTVCPDWVDAALLECGRRAALSVATPTGAVLLLGALPEVYAVPRIAQVLGTTGRLEKQTWRRILETGRFIRDIHESGGLRVESEGIRAVARVRLIHAMVRRRLSGLGASAADPFVTQPEMAFVLHAHSHVVRRGLEALGFGLTPDEARGHQHLWRFVGHLIGVDPARLAESPEAEALQYDALYNELVDGSGAVGARLVSSNLTCVAAKSRVPRGLVRAVVRRLIGPRLAKNLGVSDARIWSAMLHAATGPASLVNGLRRATPLVTSVFAVLGQAFASAVVFADPTHHEPVGNAAARACVALPQPISAPFAAVGS